MCAQWMHAACMDDVVAWFGRMAAKASRGRSLWRIGTGVCLGSLIGLASLDAVAGTQTGRVTHLIVRASDGLVHVYLDGGASGKPPCATSPYWMVKAEATLVGKQQYAALLAAKVSGRLVTIVGSNACTRWGDGEDIDTLDLGD
jgi:hypothetical protein